MCDRKIIEWPLPQKILDMAFNAWEALRANPDDHGKFEYFDFIFHVAAAKWGYHATARRFAAARDAGRQHDQAHPRKEEIE